MKRQQLDHILRAAGTITGQKRFVIVGSQALHGKYPDLADSIVMSAEVDLFAPKQPDATELLNEIGVDSPFHVTYGFYADPVDEATAVLPKGWKGRLVKSAGRRYGRRQSPVPGAARSGHFEVRRSPRQGQDLHPGARKAGARRSREAACAGRTDTCLRGDQRANSRRHSERFRFFR